VADLANFNHCRVATDFSGRPDCLNEGAAGEAAGFS
jgi:hypothetical protein